MDIRKKLTDKERIEFTKQIEDFYAGSNARIGRVLWASIISGIGRGFGFVIGGTIVVALLLWILSLLGNIPFFDNLTDKVQGAIQQGPDR